MPKVYDNSTPKLILGMCWGTHAQSLTMPRQAWNDITYINITIVKSTENVCQVAMKNLHFTLVLIF